MGSYERCTAFIDDVDGPEPADADRVLAAVVRHRLTIVDFVELDERPGQFGSYRDGTWHMALRRVRNDGASGLFERLAGTVAVLVEVTIASLLTAHQGYEHVVDMLRDMACEASGMPEEVWSEWVVVGDYDAIGLTRPNVVVFKVTIRRDA